MVASRVLIACLGASLSFPLLAAEKKGDPAKGKEVFEQCAVCHNATTKEKKMAVSLMGLYKRAKLASGKRVTDANVRARINEGGGGMPAYQELLSDDEKANLLAYLKTL